MAAIRRRDRGALAHKLAEGLARFLEEALRAVESLEALEAEVDVPAARGVWAIRVSATRGRDPCVTVVRHEAAGPA